MKLSWLIPALVLAIAPAARTQAPGPAQEPLIGIWAHEATFKRISTLVCGADGGSSMRLG